MPRLEPSTNTITRLIMAAGAKCSFPGCAQRLIENNQLIGQICHIEGASPGGQRYNSDQTDHQRRGYDNLILLCANHHKVTDDTEQYTVEVLKDMKSLHEAQMEDETSVDLTELNRVIQNIAPTQNLFEYSIDKTFQPYKEFEYARDMGQADSKLRNELRMVQIKAGNTSAYDYAKQIFGQQLAKAQQPFKEQKAISDRMYTVELKKIEVFYKELHASELSKIRGRGMGFSGQVTVLEEKLKEYKSMAIEDLNAFYGKN